MRFINVHRSARQLTIVFLSNLGNLAEKLENHGKPCLAMII